MRKVKPRRLLFKALAVLISVPFAAAAFVYAYDCAAGIYKPYKTIAQNGKYPEMGAEWTMRNVHNSRLPFDFLANGLTAWDLDGDGYDDWFLTQYEFRGNIYVIKRPEHPKSVAKWESTLVGTIKNAESSCLGDLDCDGIPEVLVSQGVEGTAEPTSISVYQYRPSDKSWQALGKIPASVGKGHVHFIWCADLDGDGVPEIIAGGRGNTGAGTKDQFDGIEYAGLFMLSAQNTGVLNVKNYHKTVIDAEIESAHGFVPADINQDGYTDIAVANSDFDTPKDRMGLVVYINKGNHSFVKSKIYADNTLYAKEQVDVGDLDNDGENEIVLHRKEDFKVFDFNKGAYHVITVEKPACAQNRARLVKLADINGDGKLDIIGALIHENGKLGKNKTAVFVMLNRGDMRFTPEVIKWGDGFFGFGEFNGEKWDLCVTQDIDRDGDIDIVANCEEYNRLTNIISVVWFENPSK